jgi:NADH:ubiquinone oxidoreductase subunit 6 (subunit J)
MNVLIIPLSLFILIILTTLTIYFVEKLMHVAIFFTVFNILIGIFYIFLGYTLLGIFQITLYSVSMATLFFYIICLIGGEDNKEE